MKNEKRGLCNTMKNKKGLSKIVFKIITILLYLVSIGVGVWVIVSYLINDSYYFNITEIVCHNEIRNVQMSNDYSCLHGSICNRDWDYSTNSYKVYGGGICQSNFTCEFWYENVTEEICIPVEVDEIYLGCKEKCIKKNTWEEAEKCLKDNGCFDFFTTIISKDYLQENPEWLDENCIPYFNEFDKEPEKYSCGNYNVEVKR